MVLDFLQPFYYRIEKAGSARTIPSATDVPNRLLLADHPLSSCHERFDHSLWDAVLKRHVKSDHTFGEVKGVNAVDYAALASDPDYQAYLEQLAKADLEELPKAELLALWMNAYNALCIRLIVEHEKTGDKLTSITKLSSSENGPVWDLPAGTVGGVEMALNQIEHDKLRRTWAEPAVHACIVCASASCPNLRAEAFVGDRLREQMDDQVRQWLKNTTKGLKLQGSRLTLSRIFLWFADDFGDWSGLQKWLPQYIEDKDLADKIRKGKVAVRYFGYDWQINRA